MGMMAKPNRAVFLAMEDLGLTGWLPGSARRLPVRTNRGENVPIQARESLELSDTRGQQLLPAMSESTRTALVVMVAAVGAVALATIATALFGRSK